MANASARYQIPAVEKMFAIVEFLLDEPRSYTISELAKRLAISKNMVFRVVRFLETRDYLEADPRTGGYQLGKAFYRIGVKMAGRYQLAERAHPHLAWLSRQTGETANLQVPAGDRLLVMDVVYPPAEYFFHLSVGSKLFYHCNAMGKCVLAHLDEDEIKKIIPAQLPIQTRKTLTTRAELLKHLKAVRNSGLGYDWEEYVPGIYCIGAPVFDVRGGVVAGVGITGLVARIDSHNRREFEDLVREAGRRISADLGYEEKR
jgi:IclR family KDG regulon transcriptional repressor